MRLELLLPVFLFVIASGCTSYLPVGLPEGEPGASPLVKAVTIPLPVIASSPNEGVTYGALTAVLLHNEKDEIATLLAPQVNHNDNFGTTATLYGAFFPSPERDLETNLSRSSRVNYDYELRVRDRSLMDRRLELNAFLYSFTDGSARFSGFGPDSPRQGETNFGDREWGFTLSAGYPVWRDTRLFLGERLREVRVVEGAVTKLPYLRRVFTPGEVPGSDGFTTHAQMVSLVYSTLDSTTMPVSGVRARVTAEGSFEALGSSASFRRVEAEAKGLYPAAGGRLVSVGRVAVTQTKGGAVPFLERSIIGGETTLRGYGRNRFIDNGSFVLNLEERIRLFRWEVFGVLADWELAPFLDLGGVADSLFELRADNLELNPGLGFRAVVRPNIVGRIDVGVGKEGPAVFVGLGYPF